MSVQVCQRERLPAPGMSWHPCPTRLRYSKKKKIWIPVIETLSIPQNNEDGIETENDHVSGKELYRSQSSHAVVCVSGLFPSLQMRKGSLCSFFHFILLSLLIKKYPLNILILHSKALGQHK